MTKKNTNSTVRLNIYVHDPLIRRQIKTAAAQNDISVSEYCVQAIADRLVREVKTGPRRKAVSLEAALERAKRFQAETFGGRAFKVSSADLIRETRRERNTDAE